LWFSGCIHLHLYDVIFLMVPSLFFHLDYFLSMIVVMG
jgi:hypothetical protein